MIKVQLTQMKVKKHYRHLVKKLKFSIKIRKQEEKVYFIIRKACNLLINHKKRKKVRIRNK